MRISFFTSLCLAVFAAGHGMDQLPSTIEQNLMQLQITEPSVETAHGLGPYDAATALSQLLEPDSDEESMHFKFNPDADSDDDPSSRVIKFSDSDNERREPGLIKYSPATDSDDEQREPGQFKYSFSSDSDDFPTDD